MSIDGKFLNQDYSPTLQLARRELDQYIAQRLEIAQDEIRIVFRLDPALAAFQVEISAGVLIFCGKNDVEVLYGVYDFVEKYLDVLFLEPGVELSGKSRLVFSREDRILIADKPYLLKRRGFIQEFPFDGETASLLDWMAKRRLNYLLTWMKYYDLLTEDLKTFAQVRGIEIESGHHNFDYWIPGARYGKEHPEFFAEQDGERIKPSGDGKSLLLSEQLCTTNPALRKELAANMVRYCDAHPEVRTVSLSPNDGFGWCECEICSQFYDKNLKGDLYNVSRHVYRAENIYHRLIDDVGRQLHQVKPDINLTFFAYVNYSAPAPGFMLQKNTAVHFAQYWRCINHTSFDSLCPINSRYHEDLQKWIAAKTGGEVNIYEYFMGINLYVSLPMLHFKEMFDEVAYYNRIGVDGLLTQFSIRNFRPYGLNYYFMSKAACNEKYEESCRTAFDKLVPGNREKLEEFYRKIKVLVNGGGECFIPYPYALFSRTVLTDFEEIYAMAQELAATAPENSILRETTVWCEYMLRFKKLFDQYHRDGVTVEEIGAFKEWIYSFKDSRIFFLEKIDMLFDAWIEAVKMGRPWLHFNLDWEDEYIKIHEKNLTRKKV